ncbi:NUDIX domain-containing protein [Novosphingobium sp.]|uniref:NUDIX domain-containing protein n=1 Tax=Novosphingobium sp. TaxID=1874826 RepID=UPI0033413A0B
MTRRRAAGFGARFADRVVARLPAGWHRALLRTVQPWRLWLWGVLRQEVEGIMVLGFADDGRLLLVRHSYHLAEHWLVPGGGRLPGEDAPAAASREMAEETGCTLHDARTVAQLLRTMPGGWTNRITLVAGRITGTPRADGREISAVTLAPPDALPAATHEAVHAYLARWREWAGSKG